MPFTVFQRAAIPTFRQRGRGAVRQVQAGPGAYGGWGVHAGKFRRAHIGTTIALRQGRRLRLEGERGRDERMNSVQYGPTCRSFRGWPI